MTMTYRCCAVVAALLLAGAAQAQGMGEPGASHVSGGVDASNDSDRFNEFKPWAQYEAASGWGVRAGWQHYSLGDWSASGQSLFVTHRWQRDAWSSNARLGLNHTDGRDHWVAAWDGMYKLAPDTSAGISFERDVVDSRWGIADGLMATTAMAVLDHQFTPGFGVGVAAGSTWFSDSNRRDILRTRWTYTLSEEKGWYAYLATRNFRFTDPYHYAYFSPDRFHEAALGLMWKTALNDWLVLSANADAGRQSIDGEGKPVWNLGLYLSSPLRARVQWKIGFASRNDHASPVSSTAQSYRYTSFTAFVRVPF